MPGAQRDAGGIDGAAATRTASSQSAPSLPDPSRTARKTMGTRKTSRRRRPDADVGAITSRRRWDGLFRQGTDMTVRSVQCSSGCFVLPFGWVSVRELC
jgi:hypothetical protein